MILALVFACSVEEAMVHTAALNPMTTLDKDIDHTPIEVTVVERVEAGGYIYLQTDEPRWLASLAKPIHPGDRVTVKPIGVARPFHSARTGRDFDALYFSVVTPTGR